MTVPPLALVPHGPRALDALAALIGALKQDDPLRAITVAVPHPWAGLSLRRALAARPGGVVNVNFLVLARAAELVGSPSLAAAGQRPRTATVTRSAVRAVLRTEPGTVLGAVADHPATEAAVTRLVDDLCSIGAEARERLVSGGGRSADLAALVERVVAAAPGRYDRHDLVRAAATAVRAGAAADQLGHVVLHLPSRLSSAEVELVEALASRDRVHVLLGTTGQEAADQLVQRLAERLAPALGAAAPLGPVAVPSRAQRIVTATDPDDEVRAALRCVVEAWDRGTPLDRIAIVHPVAQPYTRLVHEQAAAAGVPIAGRATTTLAGSVAGRTLLGALALPDADLARDEVCDWMAAAPLRTPEGHPVPVSRWDDLSREAGIVAGGIEAWRRHLDALHERLAERSQRTVVDDDERLERLARHQRRIAELRGFVEWLDGQLHALDAAGTWTDKAGWASRFLRSALGPEPTWEHWPEDQVAAAQSVFEALDRLGSLDEVEPRPSTPAFRRALTAELDAAFGRVGDVGRGAFVLPLREVVGLDLDLVVVLGLAEGTLPGRTGDDALLPDAERATLGADLPRRADGVIDQHHHLLAALAAAPERVLLMPRGDLRQSRARIPSRWLLDSVSADAGRRITTEGFDEPDLPGVVRVPSFAAGIATTAHPVSIHERDLAALLTWSATGRSARSHPLVAELPGLARGFEVLASRRRGGFNRFTGRVDGADVPTFKGGVALSPTALERWAACPRRYLFAQVLRVGRRDTPEVIDRISALDRGNLVHDVLDRFIGEVIVRTEPKSPAEAWSPVEHARLDEITDEVCRRFEDEGLVGRGVLWELDRDDIRRDLHRFLRNDDQHRADRGAVPIATELPFGPDQATGAVMDLPGGRRLSFKGFADRVDRAADGTLVVLDYKTGRLYDDVKAIANGDDPVLGGTKLQLPVYALAAATAHGDPSAPVHAAYWHITSREGFAQVGYGRTPEVEARFIEVLTRIADGIEGGVFPAYPGDTDTRFGGFTNCRHCDFDVVCGRDRLQEWEQVRDDPSVWTFVELRGLAPADEVGGDEPAAAGADPGAPTDPDGGRP